MTDISRRDLFRRLTGREAAPDADADGDPKVEEDADDPSAADRPRRDLAAKRKHRRCPNGGRPSDESRVQ